MSLLTEIYAKSISQGAVTLLRHTEHVAEAAVYFAEKFDYPFDVTLARKGAVLHDIGKIHPQFQRKIVDVKAQTLIEKRQTESYIHRHEISSLAFLPSFSLSEWPILIDLVVGHHKSIKNDASAHGILDLANNDRNWIINHLCDWEKWFPLGKELLNYFGYACKDISISEAQQALIFVRDYCKRKETGWSPWRGLLKAADHFASAFGENTTSQLSKTFHKPHLAYFFQPERQSALYPLSQISPEDPRKHTIVIAPTGAGKTDFLMKRCTNRVFYTLPFQASINAMYQRFHKALPHTDIRIQHASSKIVVRKDGNNEYLDEQLLQPLSGSSIKILTPHQLAAVVFGIKGFESIMLDVKGCDIILDEIHTYSGFSQTMVLEIIKALLYLNCRIHIGTATMPTVLYEKLLALLGGNASVYQVGLSKEILETFNRHKVFKHTSDFNLKELVKQSIAEGEKLLIIFNTVKRAQAAFKELEEWLSTEGKTVPILLLHSRFRRKDRVELERVLTDQFNGIKNKPGFKSCIVVSTQVVEVSLDISFDRMITECAPLDALIQRFGRINRYRTTENIGTLKPVHIIDSTGTALPYNKSIVEKSFHALPQDGEVLEETTLQAKIDSVYQEIDFKEIDMHLKFIDDKIILKELTDCKKSVLIDALEIEGATCILEQDYPEYIAANWEERQEMEIPVSWSVLKNYTKKYIQIEEGSKPFVIPQDYELHRKYGLELVEHENFL